jgi:hypothetical protein
MFSIKLEDKTANEKLRPNSKQKKHKQLKNSFLLLQESCNFWGQLVLDVVYLRLKSLMLEFLGLFGFGLRIFWRKRATHERRSTIFISCRVLLRFLFAC